MKLQYLRGERVAVLGKHWLLTDTSADNHILSQYWAFPKALMETGAAANHFEQLYF